MPWKKYYVIIHEHITVDHAVYMSATIKVDLAVSITRFMVLSRNTVLL